MSRSTSPRPAPISAPARALPRPSAVPDSRLSLPEGPKTLIAGWSVVAALAAMAAGAPRAGAAAGMAPEQILAVQAALGLTGLALVLALQLWHRRAALHVGPRGLYVRGYTGRTLPWSAIERVEVIFDLGDAIARPGRRRRWTMRIVPAEAGALARALPRRLRGAVDAEGALTVPSDHFRRPPSGAPIADLLEGAVLHFRPVRQLRR